MRLNLTNPWFSALIALFLVIATTPVAAESPSEPLLDTIKKFETYAEEQRREWDVAGMAIGIVHGEQILFSKGFGQRGLDDKRPVDTDTLFQIGSLSKAFTSALVAIAVDRKTLKWDDKVVGHLPAFRLSDPWVTAQYEVADLLAQRSGLPAYVGDSQVFMGFDYTDMFNHLQYFKPVSSFRSTYAYQNIFFGVAAEILEKGRKLPYSGLLKADLFEPLGMKSTTTSLSDYLASENRAEWLMRGDDGSTTRLQDDYKYNDWNYRLGPAGGINSTIADMCQWLLLQVNGGKYLDKEIISGAGMSHMQRAMVYVGDVQGIELYYALGWVRMEYSPHPVIWHDGSTLGVYNVVAYIPEEKLGIAILSNVRNAHMALGLALQFFDMYYGKPDRRWSQELLAKAKDKTREVAAKTDKAPAPVYPPMALAAYAGTYHNPIYGDAVVKLSGDVLTLTFGKNRVALTLKPWDRDIFTTRWELAQDADSKVIFTLDASGKVTMMDVEFFTKEGGGPFTRLPDVEAVKK